MRSEPEMRMPYGPGWEDPDWSPHGAPPDETAGMKLDAAPAGPPLVVGSLAQFMEVVKRFATPRRRQAVRAPIAPLVPSGQTRRWVMAGTAGFVALAALPRAPGAAEPGRAAAAEASANEPSSPGDRRRRA